MRVLDYTDAVSKRIQNHSDFDSAANFRDRRRNCRSRGDNLRKSFLGVRDARKRRKPKMTQDGLAKMVGLTRTSITNVEKGRQKFLLHTLTDIARVLQVEPASLMMR